MSLARPGRVDVTHHRMQHLRKRHRHAALALVDGHRLDTTLLAVMRARTKTEARTLF